MAIVQKNLYTPGQNLNNQAENIDLNRVADDKSFITVNFGTSPATVTIKAGSLIEVNGNQYAIETADEVFQMSNASHNYITFNGTTFASAASIGTFDSLKAGYYTGTARTLKWHIDQTNSTYSIETSIYNVISSITPLQVGGGVSINEILKITGTTASSGGSTTTSYPAGFTRSTARVLGAYINRTDSVTVCLGYGGTSLYVIIELTSSLIYIEYPDTALYHSTPYEIILMRI